MCACWLIVAVVYASIRLGSLSFRDIASPAFKRTEHGETAPPREGRRGFVLLRYGGLFVLSVWRVAEITLPAARRQYGKELRGA